MQKLKVFIIIRLMVQELSHEVLEEEGTDINKRNEQ